MDDLYVCSSRNVTGIDCILAMYTLQSIVYYNSLYMKDCQGVEWEAKK